MRVYLDNNVLIDIEDGGDRPIPGLKEKRLSTIKLLCGDKYLVLDSQFRIRLARCTPEQAYENVSVFGSMRSNINEMAKRVSPNKSNLLGFFHWNAKEVGNYPPEEILEAIDEKFRTTKYRNGIEESLLMSEAYSESTVYYSLFNLLDMVGYRRDKDNVARLYDSSHAYYAQKCSVLVSNDARMRMKAKAVYHYRNVHTRVVSAEEFLKYGAQ